MEKPYTASVGLFVPLYDFSLTWFIAAYSSKVLGGWSSFLGVYYLETKVFFFFM